MIRKVAKPSKHPRFELVTSTQTYVHPTRVGAERQERAINISKARAAGHVIPSPKARAAKRRHITGASA